jgi:hypothetical protein
MAHPEIGGASWSGSSTSSRRSRSLKTMPRQEGNQMHVILSQRAGRKSAPKKPVAAEASASVEAAPTTEE